MIVERVEEYRKEMVKTLSDLIRIKAVPPDFGGDGELERAEYLMKHLDFCEVERFDASDERARGGVRPNIVAKLRGALERTIWIVSHLDVVPEGNVELWKYPPFEAHVEGDRIYGRGAEDNGQAIVASLYAAKAIHESGLTPKYSLGLVFVSDEECGSRYGMRHLLKHRPFDKDDMFLVPDVSSPKGDAIEIAEKSILWLKFIVYGDQSHASNPKGLNAARRAMRFLIDLDEKLHAKFSAKNYLFNPPYSTFEPTKREKNVENVNTIPGIDVSYMDCRILPDYDLREVLDYINDIREFHEMRDGKKIDLEVVQSDSSPPTPESAEIVVRLKRVLLELRGIEARTIGIGGNTCAAILRSSGYVNTAAWLTADGTAHQPNEYCVVSNLVEDAKVFATLPFDPEY
ncbi:MAG: M20 family metallo-hydrolase [Archaeoglobaceae archaeon]